MVRVFRKSANQPNEMALTFCSSISRNCFRLMRDWKLETLANGKEISSVPFRTEKEEYLWRYSNPNGFSGKLPSHLTSNRNFRIFSPNIWSRNVHGQQQERSEILIFSGLSLSRRPNSEKLASFNKKQPTRWWHLLSIFFTEEIERQSRCNFVKIEVSFVSTIQDSDEPSGCCRLWTLRDHETF